MHRSLWFLFTVNSDSNERTVVHCRGERLRQITQKLLQRVSDKVHLSVAVKTCLTIIIHQVQHTQSQEWRLQEQDCGRNTVNCHLCSGNVSVGASQIRWTVHTQTHIHTYTNTETHIHRHIHSQTDARTHRQTQTHTRHHTYHPRDQKPDERATGVDSTLWRRLITTV